jgi:hypothetical protein
MPSATRTLTTNFIGKTDSLEKAFKRVNKGSALMSDKMARGLRMGMGAFAGLGAAAVGAVALVKPMVDAAADVGESLSKNRVLFGDAAEGVAQWAETSTRSFGISRREALEAVGVFGALTHAMGMSGSEGSEMSRTMVRLAGDMASFNNASPEETLVALQAGLRGEAEPLRRYGVLLDQATLKTRALAEGIITNTKKAMTPQEKALAAYSEILAQTQVQQGDFGRTSDSLANQQKILSGTFDDLRITIGEGLLPAFNAIVTSLNETVLPAIQAFAEDPSLHQAGKSIGAMVQHGFGDGFEEGMEEDKGRIEQILSVAMALGGPHQQFRRWGEWGLKAILKFQDGFEEGIAEAKFQQALEHMFDMAAENVGDRFADGLRQAMNQLTLDDFVIEDFPTATVAAAAAPSADLFTVIAELEAAAQAATAAAEEAAAEPMPGLSNAEVENMVSNAAVAAAEAVLATAAVAAVVETAVEAATAGPVLDQIVAAVGDAAPAVDDPFVERVVKAAAAAAPPALTPEEEFHKAFKHLTDAELAAFFGMPAGPSTRGGGVPVAAQGGFVGPPSTLTGGTVGTIIINAPLVTGDQVIGALRDSVENEGLTLPPRWSGSLGR